MEKIVLDTHPLVDFVEKAESTSETRAAIREIFHLAKSGEIKVGISIATLAELGYVVVDEEAKDYALGYLLESEHIQKHAATAEIAVLAGEIKRSHRVSLGDSIIVATAIKNECGYVISNDPDMKKITEIKIASPKEFLKELKK